jgi:hypothetical protein
MIFDKNKEKHFSPLRLAKDIREDNIHPVPMHPVLEHNKKHHRR